MRAARESAEQRLTESQAAANAAAEQSRRELDELRHQVEERKMALLAAREEQAELIEALNTASAEREALQLVVSDKQDEQARLVDLENQISEALRVQQSEVLAHEQEQRRLTERLAEETDRRGALEEEVGRLKALLASMDEDHTASDSQLRAEHQDLLDQIAQRDKEVEQLRAVLEEYVDQIKAVQAEGGAHDEVAALRAELDMVREQAIHDVAQMREQLAAAESQKRRLQQADGREAVSLEVMRQRIEALETSLNERQRLLGEAEESRQMLEDAMEDRDRQLDELRRELEKAQVEADEAVFSRREAETARDQLQQALYQLHEDAEQAKVTDLRDERLRPSRRAIGIDSVAGSGRWVSGLLGGALVLGALEVLSVVYGPGELFTTLLNLAGR